MLLRPGLFSRLILGAAERQRRDVSEGVWRQQPHPQLHQTLLTAQSSKEFQFQQSATRTNSHNQKTQTFALTWIIFSTVETKLKLVLVATAASGMKGGKHTPQEHSLTPSTHIHPFYRLTLSCPLASVNICFYSVSVTLKNKPVYSFLIKTALASWGWGGEG